MKIRYLRHTARWVSLGMALFWFFFALLSGAGQYGGGLRGVFLNSPNALPWLVLLGLVWVAWKWELIGGILIVLMGLFTMVFFNVFKHLFALYAMTLPLTLLGGAFVLLWYLSRKSL